MVDAGVNITYHEERILKPDWNKPMAPHFRLDNNVIIFSLFPGIREDLIRHIIHTPNLKAIVMRTFGSGNAPQRPWLLNALKEGTKNGKVIVNISQCMQGCVEMGRYDTGFHLKEAGVVSGYDSTVESGEGSRIDEPQHKGRNYGLGNSPPQLGCIIDAGREAGR